MNNQPIGVFDSGVGGLSVLKELHKLLPLEHFCYIADQVFMPYGSKTKEELLERVSKILDFFVKQKAKLVVFACNTATMYTIDEMRSKYQIPIVATVPVVKKLAEVTKTKQVAVLATPAGARSQYLKNLITKYAIDINVEVILAFGLADLIENGNIPNEKTHKMLLALLAPFVVKNIDAIALGSTHYPFLRSQIQEIVGPDVVLLDSGGAVARRVSFILEHNKIAAKNKSKENDEFNTTGDKEKFQKVAEELLGKHIQVVCHVGL